MHFISVDFARGSPGLRPQYLSFEKDILFLKKIQMIIFENSEITSETKTKNLNTTRHTTMKQLFQLFTPDNLLKLQNFISLVSPNVIRFFPLPVLYYLICLKANIANSI